MNKTLHRAFIAVVSLLATILLAASVAISPHINLGQGLAAQVLSPPTQQLPPTQQFPSDQQSQQPDSNIIYTVPRGENALIVGRNLTLTFNALDFITENSAYTVTCLDIDGYDTVRIASIVRNGCNYIITPVATLSASLQATAAILLLRYRSSGGSSLDAQLPITIGPDSNITYSGPAVASPMYLKRNVNTTIDASVFASDGDWEVTCTNATESSNVIQIVSRTGCLIELSNTYNTAPNTPANLFVFYSSKGGASHTGTIAISDSTETSNISFATPPRQNIPQSGSITIDASPYAADTTTAYRIFCTGFDMAGTGLTVTRDGCNYTITASATAPTGRTSFRVNYTSTGGSTLPAAIPLRITAPSTITFTRPTDLTIGANGTKKIDASAYVAEVHHGYTITCGAATNITLLQSVTRADATNRPCEYTVTASITRGSASFTVPYSSSGGASTSGNIPIRISPSDSNIVFSGPTSQNPLAIKTNSHIRIDLSRYATDGDYEITCSNIRVSSGDGMRITFRNGCVVEFFQNLGMATGSLRFNLTSAGGSSSSNREIWMQGTGTDGGGISEITATPPSNLVVSPGKSITIDASSYVTEATSAYKIFCTGFDMANTNLTITRNDCNYTITASATAPATTASFTVNYSSSGSARLNQTIDIAIGSSDIVFTPPTDLTIGQNRTKTINVANYVSDANYAITCGDATNIDTTELQSVTHTGDSCEFTITPKTVQGDASFTIAYTSSGGDTYSGSIPITVGPDSTIVFTAPTNLKVGTNRTQVIDAASYVTDGNYAITCGGATDIDTVELQSVIRAGNSCEFTITPKTTEGTATFTVPYTSAGGHTLNGEISIAVGPASTITSTQSPILATAANKARNINAASWVREEPQSGYAITCGDATNIDTTKLLSVTHTGNSCSFTITPRRVGQGTIATFTIPYISSGGHTLNRQIPIEIGPPSNIRLPSGQFIFVTLKSGRHSFVLDLGRYASDGDYTITCDTVQTPFTFGSSTTMIHSQSVNGCIWSADITMIAGGNTIGFNVRYSSTGSPGARIQRTFNIRNPNTGTSSISATAIGLQRTWVRESFTLNATTYATETTRDTETTSGFHISCLDATGVDPKLTISRRGCNYTITAGNNSGQALFTIPYRSTGGASVDLQVRVLVRTANVIDIDRDALPRGLSVGAGGSIAIDASAIAVAGVPVRCTDATEVSNKFSSVSRNGCIYTATAKSTSTGSATFKAQFATTGGVTAEVTITVTIGAESRIAVGFPTNLAVPAGGTLTIDVSSYPQDGSYTVTCGAVTVIDTIGLQSVTRPDAATKPCEFLVTAKGSPGSTNFIIPFTSSGGTTSNASLTLTVGPASDIVFSPGSNLIVGRNRTLEINAAGSLSDSSYTVTCGDAVGVDSTRLTAVTRTANTCTYTIDPIDSLATNLLGKTTFFIPLTSSGGDTLNGEITVNISFDSTIIFNAPSGLKVGSNRTRTIDASSYAADSYSAYTISCGTASSARTTIVVLAGDSPCHFRITPISTGSATFIVPFTSTGGHTLNAQFSIEVGPNSDITFTAPSTNPSVLAGSSITLDASATDGSYVVSCGDAADVDAKITVRRSGCMFVVTAGATSGTATFTVPYTSSGAHTLNRTISVTINLPPSYIFFREPFDLELGTNQTLMIDASDYASDGGYRIFCNDATAVDTSIINVRRPNARSEPCEFTITPTSTQGVASFTVPYTSSGGASRNGVFTIEVGPASAIAFAGPTGLKLGTNRTRIIDAADYATDGGYLIECGDATNVDSKITVQRTNNIIKPCEFTVTPTGAQGAASFTVPYTSSGGATLAGTINIEIGAASTIVYTAPPGLTMTASGTITINAATAVTDGSYTITCGQATNRDSKIIRATNTGCEYQITTGAGTGTATFTVPYTSAGGHTLDGQISITVTELPRTTAPALDRQDMICAMLGLEPVRHSTADEITQGDNQAVFCHTPPYIHCQRGANSALTPILRGRSLGQTIQDCYNTIN